MFQLECGYGSVFSSHFMLVFKVIVFECSRHRYGGWGMIEGNNAPIWESRGFLERKFQVWLWKCVTSSSFFKVIVFSLVEVSFYRYGGRKRLPI